MILAGLVQCACGKSGTAVVPASSTATVEAQPMADAWMGVFPAFPGARKLCSQHVSANVMHIVWTAYATASPPAEVIAFYEKHHGALAVERKGAMLTLRAGENLHLSVHPKESEYPTCDVLPATGDATVIIVSQSSR
jgi:hypothetical protein